MFDLFCILEMQFGNIIQRIPSIAFYKLNTALIDFRASALRKEKIVFFRHLIHVL